MGSIPVAGANKAAALVGGGFVAPVVWNPSPRACERIGFAFAARRSTSSLVRRRAREFSPKARFPPGLPI